MKRIFAIAAAFLAVTGASALSLEKKPKVLKLDFSEQIVEQKTSALDITSLLSGSLSSEQITLLQYVRAIDAAASDPKISGIYMTPDNQSLGMAGAEEVRAALARFRQSGKPVISYCNTLGNASYYIASVADKVILNPQSESMLTGLSTMQFFLKDALDALGIEMQLIRHGKYKSAGEMFIRNDISPENRQQYEELFSSIWGSWCQEISDSRGFTPEQFNGWIDNLELVLASDFKERDLVDETWFKSQLDDYLCDTFGFRSVEQARYVKMGKYASKLKKGSFVKRIAVIYADGDIVMDGMTGDIVGDKLANSIKKVRKDPTIMGVVFRVNSPGGSVEASEIIRQEMNRLAAEKPVVVSYGDYAASGGYWISAGAGTIFTDRSTLTGSIGVFSMVPSVGNAVRNKLHVNPVTIGTNQHSSMTSIVEPLSDSEVEFFQKQVEEIYDQFTGIVAEGRSLTQNFVDSIAQGRVWSGAESIELGLTDHIGGLADALSYMSSQLGFGDNYRVIEYPEFQDLGLLSLLLGGTPDLDENLTSGIQKTNLIDLEKAFPFASSLRYLEGPATYARLPFILTVK